MIGYVQMGTCCSWHGRINGWILQYSRGTRTDVCPWYESEMLDKLEEDSVKGIARCRSCHSRAGGASGSIVLHHIWVKLGEA